MTIKHLAARKIRLGQLGAEQHVHGVIVQPNRASQSHPGELLAEQLRVELSTPVVESADRLFRGPQFVLPLERVGQAVVGVAFDGGILAGFEDGASEAFAASRAAFARRVEPACLSYAAATFDNCANSKLLALIAAALFIAVCAAP